MPYSYDYRNKFPGLEKLLGKFDQLLEMGDPYVLKAEEYQDREEDTYYHYMVRLHFAEILSSRKEGGVDWFQLKDFRTNLRSTSRAMERIIKQMGGYDTSSTLPKTRLFPGDPITYYNDNAIETAFQIYDWDALKASK